MLQVSEEVLNESVPDESVVESAPLETSTSGSRLHGVVTEAEAEGKPVRASMQRKLTEALQPQQYAPITALSLDPFPQLCAGIGLVTSATSMTLVAALASCPESQCGCC